MFLVIFSSKIFNWVEIYIIKNIYISIIVILNPYLEIWMNVKVMESHWSKCISAKRIENMLICDYVLQ